jgi:hypothetical protein
LESIVSWLGELLERLSITSSVSASELTSGVSSSLLSWLTEINMDGSSVDLLSSFADGLLGILNVHEVDESEPSALTLFILDDSNGSNLAASLEHLLELFLAVVEGQVSNDDIFGLWGWLSGIELIWSSSSWLVVVLSFSWDFDLDGSAHEVLSVELHGLVDGLLFGELDESSSFGSSVVILEQLDEADVSAALEEVLNVLFGGVEVQLSDEDLVLLLSVSVVILRSVVLLSVVLLLVRLLDQIVFDLEFLLRDDFFLFRLRRAFIALFLLGRRLLLIRLAFIFRRRLFGNWFLRRDLNWLLDNDFLFGTFVLRRRGLDDLLLRSDWLFDLLFFLNDFLALDNDFLLGTLLGRRLDNLLLKGLLYLFLLR